MKSIDFGVHLPVMDFGECFSKEKIILCARKAEDLGYDSPSVKDQLSFRTSLHDAASTLSSVAQPLTR
jgi:hypothetical protein